MQFIKTHLFSLICGVLGLSFITFAVMGMMSDDVKTEMEARVSSARKIDSLRGSVKNQEIISEERRRGEQFEREYKQTLEEAYAINRREPLTPGVFPKASSLSTPFKFINDYQGAIRRLPGKLDAGDLPTEKEIQDEQANINIEKEAKQQVADETSEDFFRSGSSYAESTTSTPRPRGGGPGLPPTATPGTAPLMLVGPGSSGGRRPGNRRPGITGRPSAARSTETDDPKENAALRAAIKKARAIRMYLDPGALYQTDIVRAEQAPNEQDLWFAQMSLWIQEDVINALAKLNEKAAAQVIGREANVTDMPVKRFESIAFHGYRLPEQPLPFPPAYTAEGTRSSAKTAVAQPSFTGRKSDEEFDVISFTLVMWVDQRELLKVVDALTKENFYQCYDIDYEVATEANKGGDYMFGTAPVVRATFEVEGYFARAVYKQWMPPKIAKILGVAEEDGEE